MTFAIATLPYRGLRCRELACQAEIILAPTTRGRTMPLDKDPLRYGDAAVNGDQGLFVMLDEFEVARTTAYGIRAGREKLELDELPAGATVYRAHWATCANADRFRR